MFARVLFPTDFSRQADKLACCLHQMKALGTDEIVLLNVMPLGPQIGFASDTFEKMVSWKHDAEARLNQIQRDLEAKGIRARCRLEPGDPALEIVRVAAEERVDLIAMGTHGHGFLRGTLLGSVSHEVIRNATVPVLALKISVLDNLGATDCGFVCQHIFRRVLLPTDFSDCAAEALAQVKQLRSAGVAEVVVLHVRADSGREGDAGVEDVAAKMQQIRSQLEFLGFKVTTIMLEGKPAPLIDRVAREQDVSLIVIVSHGRSAAEDVLLGSVSDAVICRHAQPVLVVRRAHAATLV
jgi:nucleotide-binding universal stress UspA family protein